MQIMLLLKKILLWLMIELRLSQITPQSLILSHREQQIPLRCRPKLRFSRLLRLFSKQNLRHRAFLITLEILQMVAAICGVCFVALLNGMV